MGAGQPSTFADDTPDIHMTPKDKDVSLAAAGPSTRMFVESSLTSFSDDEEHIDVGVPVMGTEPQPKVAPNAGRTGDMQETPPRRNAKRSSRKRLGGKTHLKRVILVAGHESSQCGRRGRAVFKSRFVLESVLHAHVHARGLVHRCDVAFGCWQGQDKSQRR